jgi:hypothetical protein
LLGLQLSVLSSEVVEHPASNAAMLIASAGTTNFARNINETFLRQATNIRHADLPQESVLN